MNTYEFLRYLSSLDIKLSTDDGNKLKCDAPKGTLTPDLQAEIVRRKLDILEILKEAAVVEKEKSTIQPVPRDRDLPLSFSQQTLWFLQQLEPESHAYHITQTLRLQGELHLEALKQAFVTILKRHESLRTQFVIRDGVPFQVIAPAPEVFELPLIDLSAETSEQQESRLKSLLQGDSRRVFDLSADLMLRATLFRLQKQEHVLQTTMHHIASDGWSMGIFTEELSTLYQAFSCGQANPLSELPIQYADFAQWQQQWLGEVLKTQVGYWKQQLHGAPPLLELPTDYPRPSQFSYRGATFVFQVSEALTNRLKQLAQKTETTLFMVLLAAFNTLLYRYTQQEDIVLGSPIANRNRVEVEKLIGFFANILVLRTDLSGNPSFRSLLSRVRKLALDAYEHQDLPFEKLVEELHPERNLSYAPLFQVIFALQNAPQSAPQLPGLSLQTDSVTHETAKFDLTLFMTESAEGLQGSIEYSTDLFEAATIKRMSEHFQTLLEAVVANPNEAIATLSLLTEAERHQLLVQWNRTQTDYPSDKCIHQLFEAQVERTPDGVAVIYQDQQVSYRELNKRSNQLAHYLQSLGVGSETLVGISVERSLEMVVGLLGILKTGAAYVPLDPGYPAERLAFMIEDTQVSVLLTESQFLEQFVSCSTQLICLDTQTALLEQQSSENLTNCTTADGLSYVMYTSGSTGQPKGVSVRHRGVVRLVQNTDYVHISAEDVFLQLAPIAFDAATFEIWGALLNGARLVLFPHSKPTLVEMGQVIADYQVTILWLTAGLFHLMVDERLDDLRSVRQLLAGGDVLSVPHVKKVVEQLPGCTLINGYGPTENTTFTCCYAVTAPEQIGQSIPIGRPIANTQVYILDEYQQPVPIGVPGELYAGGDGVARGYFKRPALSQQRFISNPFSSEPDDRLYKTGDLVRYLPDGTIEFLGRIDNQVKIRGFRIELGEIQTVLSQHPAVQQCLVIVREDEPGDKRLVAYVVSEGTDEVSPGELRQFLQQRLPLYMIPSAFVQLEALPLTPNGKLDRRALPNPHLAHCIDDKSFVSPRTELERQLVFIWEQVLNVTPIGVKDNFFELGGNSLLTIRLLYEIEKSLKQKIPVATLFQLATIEQMARCLENSESLGTSSLQIPTGLTAEEYQQLLAIVAGRPGKQVSPDSLMVAVREQGTKPPLFICANAYDEVFPLTKNLDENQPVYLLETGLWVTGNNESQIKAIAAHHVRDILLVQPEPPYLLGGYCFGGLVAYEIAQQLLAKGKQVDLVLLLERYGFNPIYQLFDRLDVFITDHWIHLSSLNFAGKLRYIQTNIKRLIWERFSKSPKNQEDKAVLAHPYQPQPYPGKVVLICSIPNRKDPVPLGRFIQIIPAEFTLFLFKRAGWTPHTLPNLKILTTRGDHVSITEEPHVKLLAKKIQAYIDDEQNH